MTIIDFIITLISLCDINMPTAEVVTNVFTEETQEMIRELITSINDLAEQRANSQTVLVIVILIGIKLILG